MKTSIKKYLLPLILIFTALVLLIVSRFLKPTVYYEWNNPFYFNTVISLSFYSNQGEEKGNELIAGCEEIIKEIEDTFSRTRETSVLYQINHRTSNTVEVPAEVAALIQVGLHYYDISGRKFDITVAPLSDLWDFTGIDPHVPDQDKIQSVLSSVGADQISVDGTTVTFANDDVMIDLGALAKGYAADKVKSYLVQNGVTCGMLNFGGNVITIGSKRDKTPWRIGIRKPFSTSEGTPEEYVAVVPVEDKTLVTSGIYERCFTQDGILYHHILDPDTGYPVKSDIVSVSILTDSSLTADALSTTCLLLNYENARALIDSLPDVEAVFILDNDEIISTY